MTSFDYIVVGSGIIGMSCARELSIRHPGASVCVIDKEPAPARHASGRNSGILHAGFYYSAESLKARLCADGNRLLTEYCLEKGLRIDRCGKVVCAASPDETAGVDELLRRGRVNGIDVKAVDVGELRELEPAARTFGRALWSPTTAVVDPEEVCLSLAGDLRARGVEFMFDTKFLRRLPGRAIETSQGRLECDALINCAGLYADRVAHRYGVGEEYTVIPFKGYYYRYKHAAHFRRHVYPVPNLANPFLGVAFTRCADGTAKCGPTATPVFWRECYGLIEGFRLDEAVEISLWEALLFAANDFNFRDLALVEMKKYLKSGFVKMARRLMPSADPAMFGDSLRPGIRAQLLDRNQRRLEMDFVIRKGEASVHVLNAVSPAFTCSFAFARLVVDEAMTS
ncbi:MAG: L-2-hydroxyglutarate oxidase [Proteobacteria bacterium]|nr:L-2-hydroxyglutarate oxidase [Pseudomonadota bacterium]